MFSQFSKVAASDPVSPPSGSARLREARVEKWCMLTLYLP